MQITQQMLNSHHDRIMNEWSSKYQKTIKEIFTTNEISSFLDIGANTGGVIEFILREKLIPNVYAFEPLEQNYEMLQSLKVKYSNEEVNIHTFPLAIYYGVKEAIAFGEERDENTGGMFLNIVSDNFKSKIPNPVDRGFIFKCDTLENVLSNVDSIDLCKIDVEGSEWNILEHSTFIKDKVKHILLEIHWKNQNEANDFLRSHLPNFSIIKADSNMIYLRRV